MSSQPIESGQVEYTERAFNQDASEAMRGDIVRGLIELITNSDDSYQKMGLKKAGKIRVHVEHRKNRDWKVIVLDRAVGIEDLKASIIRIGAQTSDFHSGEATRGNLGRGAKDLAGFGVVTFRTVWEGRYEELELRPDGGWDLLARRKATKADKELIGCKRSGTMVQVQVSKNIRCPRHNTLKKKLSAHYALREIMTDAMRQLDIISDNTSETDLLTYQEPDCALEVQEDLNIVGYPDAKAALRICRLPVRSSDGPDETGRPNGILIKGARAVYENTLFSLEGQIQTGWFAGEVRCEFIDQLAREYDDRLEAKNDPTPENPLPIIRRSRDGLNDGHPFYSALKKAVEPYLKKLVEREMDAARIGSEDLESRNTREALDHLGSEAGKLLNSELRDIEAEELPFGPGGGEAPLLSLVPEQVYAYLGEDRVLTVAARREGIEEGDLVQISADPGGVLEILTPSVPLKPHSRREDVLVGQVRLRPLLGGDSTIISAELEYREAHALVEVREEREVIEEEIEPPESLQFQKGSHRVGWQRKRTIWVEAPADVVADIGEGLTASSSDPGIVLHTPQVELEYSDEHGFYRAGLEIEARTLGAIGQLHVRAGDLSASTHITVTRKEEGLPLRIRLVPHDHGYYRAIVATEHTARGAEYKEIQISVEHPGLKPLLGRDRENQESKECREALAEITADTLSRIVVEELYRLRRSIEDFDSARFYREHYKRMARFLPRFQKLLVTGPQRNGGQGIVIEQVVGPVNE